MYVHALKPRTNETLCGESAFSVNTCDTIADAKRWATKGPYSHVAEVCPECLAIDTDNNLPTE